MRLLKTKTFHTTNRSDDQNLNFNVHIKESVQDVNGTEQLVRYARLFNNTYTYDVVFMDGSELEKRIVYLSKYGLENIGS